MAELFSPSNDDRNIATVTHLGGTVFSFIPGLLVWALKKDDSPYIADQAKEALNFQITVLIAQFIAGILVMILVGFIFIGIIWLLNIVFVFLPPSLPVKVRHTATLSAYA